MMIQEDCSPELKGLVREVFAVFFHVRKRMKSRFVGTWE